MNHAVTVPLTRTGIPDGKLGMWIFLATEIMFFTGLIGSYIVLRFGSPAWPRPGDVLNTTLLAVNTLVLITSSLTMALGLDAIQRGRARVCARFLLLTALLGCVFLGIKAFDYQHMWHRGFTITTNLFGNCYYLLTGFHALHVVGGVVLLLYLWGLTLRGRLTADHWGRIEYGGLYWHFVDVVWVLLFAILCLV